VSKRRTLSSSDTATTFLVFVINSFLSQRRSRSGPIRDPHFILEFIKGIRISIIELPLLVFFSQNVFEKMMLFYP